MAIQVSVIEAAISRDGVAVRFGSTNDDYPGETVGFTREYADGTTSQEIKTAVDAAVELYWLARGIAGWTV